jgi:hypothetical protein
MSTKRRPINPPPCIRFTRKAIAIFKRMIEDDCEGEEYDKLGREHRHELKLTPGESYPIFIALVGSIVPADAASTFAIGGGLNLNHVQTGATATTHGTAAAGSLANGTSTSIGAGFAASSPLGGISTGVGASVGQSNAVSGAVSIGNGTAMSNGFSNNIGVGVGGGFANVLP